MACRRLPGGSSRTATAWVRRVVVVVASGGLALTATVSPSSAGARSAAVSTSVVPVPGEVAPGLAAALARGTLRQVPAIPADAQEPITLTLVLRRTDQVGFERYLNAVERRGSPQFRHFLSQRQLADRYGPSADAYTTTYRWLHSNGFTLLQGSANRLTLTVRGTRAQAQRALHVKIADYVTDTGQRFYANPQDPSLPAPVARNVASIGGLTNLGQPQAPQVHAILYPFCLLWAKAQLSSWVYNDKTQAYELNDAETLTNLNKCFTEHHTYTQTSLTRRQPRHAALARPAVVPHAIDGSGQRIGLLEFDNFHISDVADYLSLIDSSEPIGNLSEVDVDGGAGSPGAGEAEVLLDADIAMSAAPAAHVVVYDAPRSTSWETVFNAMVNDGDTVISNSWSSCEDQISQAEAQSIDSVLTQAAASGITVLNGSGDSGSTCLDGSPNTIGVPADSPSATAVGGTSLAIGPGPTYVSETWWDGSQADPQTGQGGFGVSRYFARPSYQDGDTASTMRSVPDVAVDADPAHGYAICEADAGGCPNGLSYGGTSAATPLMAAMVATLNQDVGHDLGPLNPSLYPLGNTPAFHTATSMGSDFAHVGLGSPDMDRIGLALKGVGPGAVDAASSLLVDSASGATQADGQSADHVVAFLRDDDGNVMSGKHVTLAVTGSAVVTPAGATSSSANGAATFDVTDTTAEPVTLTATDTDDNVTLAPLTIDFAPPVATGAQIYGGPGTVANDGSSQATITVYLENSLRQPAPGKTVTISQGGGHAVITPGGSATPGTTAVTDSAGNATFAVTDTSAEAVDFTATDTSDGNLPVPGSVLINFAPGGTTCNTTLPTASSGYSVSAFATGFPYTSETVVYPGNFTVSACTSFESAPAFDASGNAYVADTADGTIHVLPPSGGTPSTTNQLPDANFPGGSLGQLAFGTDGSLYAGVIQTNGSVTNPEIVQLDPTTGATTKVIASTASGLPDCPFVLAADPLSGDLFTDDECNGYASSNQISRIHDPDGPNPTVSDYLTTVGCNLGMMFAPDGTLYLANCNGEVDEIGGTNTSNPTATKVADAPSVASVAVTAADADGHATALEAYSFSGNVTAIDPTTDPATATPAATGTALLYITATGAGGCGYGTIAGTIVKVGPTSCGSTDTTAGPQLTLHESSGSASPPTGSPVSFTATLSNVPGPSGTPIHFDVTGPNPGASGLVNADNSGTATLSYDGVFQGVDSIVASTVVNGQTVTSAPIQVHWTAGKSTSLLDLNNSPQGGTVGNPTTVTASLLDATATPPTALSGRNVMLGLGDQSCQAQTDRSGVASCALTPPSTGLLRLTASYSGDSTYTPSFATTQFDATTGSARPTSTTVNCSPASVDVSSPTTCTATVTDTGTGTATTPTDTVSFTTDSSGTFGGSGSCTLSGSGSTATCQQTYTPTALGSGTHTITASYGGDAGHLSSAGATALTVSDGSSGGGGGGGGGGGRSGPTPTATSLSSSANPSTANHMIVFVATVTPPPSSSTIPATQSSVAFLDNGQAIPRCGAVPADATTGTARCTVSYPVAGRHRITAIFSGGGSLAGSQSPILTEIVTGAGPSAPTGTATTLRSAVHRPVTGRRVTYTARVRPAPDGGTVRFFDGGRVIRGCRVVPVLPSTGTARCHLRFATHGIHLLQAAYSGDHHFTGSQSPTLRQRIRWSVRFHGAPLAGSGAVVAAVRCVKHSAGCRVTVRLVERRHPGVIVGRRSGMLAAATTQTLVIALNPTGRQRLAVIGRLPVTVVLRLRVAGHRHTAGTRKVVVRQL